MELNQIMSKDDFLKLFLAQIQNQNPLEPMDGLDFTAQLAQFSTLEQLQNMNAQMETLISHSAATENALAVSFIGKEVTYKGNSLVVKEGETQYKIRYSLAKDASDVTIMIKNDQGTIVATLDQGERKSGDNEAYWDGLDKNGSPVPPGNYTFLVSAQDLEGDTVIASAYSSGEVTGVSFENDEIYLEVNGAQVNFKDIVSINQKSS